MYHLEKAKFVSGRGRKALNLGATPKNAPPNAAVSPAPASLPHPSPNTTTGTPSTPNAVQVQQANQVQQQQQQQQQLVTVTGAQTNSGGNSSAAGSGAAAPPPNSALLASAGQSQHQHQQHQHQQQAQLQQHLARHPPIPGAPPPGGGGGGTGLQQQQQQQQHQQQHLAQSIVIKSEAGDNTMKDQPQQPMAPMAFYPTWQADPSQGWQNQFIQQIPQNTPAITPLNSLEFQPQGYAAYQPNGYVQTAGIGFDPNYGRTYAAPPAAVQRYDFQAAANQIAAPINQVSLQSVSFAPTVTYAGQVPASADHQFQLQLQQQQQQQQQQKSAVAASSATSAAASAASASLSGNDMPGYPRVSSVPPRSLNCNGYSGQQEYSGPQQQQTTTTASPTATTSSSTVALPPTSVASNTAAPPSASTSSSAGTGSAGGGGSTSSNNNNMHPPGGGVPQSPNRMQQQPPRPNSNQLYAQQSPNPYNGGGSGGSLQQSPSHNGNTSYTSGMHTPSPMSDNQQQQQQQQHLQQSPSHLQQQQTDWGWTQQQQQQQQSGADLFSQSDRVNLNSRLKTMIMNKSADPKDALGGGHLVGHHQQQQTGGGSANPQAAGHFLSYSHHLRDSLTPTHHLAPGSGQVGQSQGSSAQQQQQSPPSVTPAGGMMAPGGGDSNSNSSSGTTPNEGGGGTTLGGDGGASGGLIGGMGNLVDPNWKQHPGGGNTVAPGNGNSNSNSSSNVKSPLDHHHQQQQQQHHLQQQQQHQQQHHHLHHDLLVGGGDLHQTTKHSVFEQKQQLIDKNNGDPGGGGLGSPSSLDLKPKMGKSSASSSPSSGGSPSTGSKAKKGDKHGKQSKSSQQQQQHHHLDPSLDPGKGYSSFMHHEHHHLQQHQQQHQYAPHLNQTYPGGGSTTSNGSGGYSPAAGSSMMLDSAAVKGGSLLDDKGPLNRFRHDTLASGFNSTSTNLHQGTAFHHPSAGAPPSNYNLMAVKKEPGLLLDGSGGAGGGDGGSQSAAAALGKFDGGGGGGYEKNYQNFIRYGDYGGCTDNGASQAAQSQVPGAAADYNSYYSPYAAAAGGYSSYGGQNYPNYHNHQATGGGGGGGFGAGGAGAGDVNPLLLPAMAATSSPIAHQTNFEQQIPAHTYPIPKNSSLTAAASEGGVPIKLETDDSGAYLGLGVGAGTSLEPPGTNPTVAEGSTEGSGGSGGGSSTGTPSGGTTGSTTNTTTTTTTTTTTSSSSSKSKSKKGDKKDKSKDSHGGADGPEGKAEGGSSTTTTSKSGGGSKSKKDSKSNVKKEPLDPAQKADEDKLEKSHKPEAPDCDCFSGGTDKAPSEPGSYYTHLGCAATLEELRRETESRVGLTGKQLRIEKVVYTGKEGKSSQGCPIAKWVIRRVDQEEKLLFVVKRRQGHRCRAAYIVICIVVWDGIPAHEADSVYRMLSVKLNKFGLPTVRRCATNENRTCACQGLDPESCGVSYSFGCSWSMYYNGCKYARSKTVRKFRLSVKNEEAEIEERMNVLATMLSPLYVTVAPQAFQNQVQYEREAPDCRLGLKPGKPFSGVTCCLDFCAHTHRDLHNMQDGCTVQVTLLKPLPPGVKPDDEQLHILPLYTMDTTDEFDSEEGQKKKHDTGAVQALEKFQTEVRVRSTPLQPCRRHGKKRGNGKDEKLGKDGSDGGGTAPETPPPPPPPTKKESKSKSKKSSSSSSGSTTAAANGDVASPGGAGGSQSGGGGGGSSSGAGSPRALTPGSQKSAGGGGGKTIGVGPASGNGGSLGVATAAVGVLGDKLSPMHGAGTVPTLLAGGLPQAVAAGNNTSAFTAPGNAINSPNAATNSTLIDMASMIDNFTDAQLQSNQISSTVLDSPYSYDYNTGQYIDNRQYYNNWPTDYYGNPRGGDPSKLGLGRNEEIPDTTTRPGSNSSNSAFSPSIPDPTKTPTPIHMDDYGTTKLGAQAQQQQQQQQQQHQSQQQQHPAQQQTQNTYHTLQQPEQGFVKPKPPDYNPAAAAGYGYHHANTAMSYGYHPHHHPPYHHHHHHHTPYDPYQNYNYGYPPQTYHHHAAAAASYHNMYPASAQTQLPGTGPAPPPPPTAVIPAPPPPSNWNLYPAHIGSAPTQLHVAAATGAGVHHGGGGKQSAVVPSVPSVPKETLGEVTETNENVDCFEDPQMGGVAIALPHGSVIIECAKLEMHSTTAVKKPNRLNPTRMTLIFYQHRNLNRPKHGIAEWAEKMRLKKLGIPTNDPIDDKDMLLEDADIKAEPLDELHHLHHRHHMGDEHDMMDVEYPGV
ncbi:methylcytosine dioxygenase TET-like [Anopheles cruzii]|uniref:methylcytosine dioxygenase TET-like n=1 Tax=Anopheles cruzii TaxID=68878 RepID=UPI0022EC4214|nr:methylcytosine dioxygenase TET-like [Anopheles cruzii]